MGLEIGMGMDHRPWTMDYPKNPILSFTQALTTWDGPVKKPREEAFKVPKKEAKENSHQERDKTLPTQDKMDFRSQPNDGWPQCSTQHCHFQST